MNTTTPLLTALREQKEMKMKLVPILDEDKHIVDIINLEKFKTRLPVDAVMMAGGKGERLRPLTEKTPKPLLPVGDKAIIDHNVDRLINVLKSKLVDNIKYYEDDRRSLSILNGL